MNQMAEFIVENGIQFEQLTKERNKHDPKFKYAFRKLPCLLVARCCQ
jgi:hypothetical protein